MTTAHDLIEEGRKRLLKHRDKLNRTGDEREQARELLEHAVGAEVYDDDEVGARARRRYDAFLQRREAGEPVAYIRGFEEFRGLKLAVEPGAFISRVTTEFLAQTAIARARRRRGPIVADLATGVGGVAIAVARAVPEATVYGTDISTVALRLARRNARANAAPNAKFARGSMFDPLPPLLRGSFDVIASHPPYVASHELDTLPAEIIDYEPVESITDASSDGLHLLRVIVAEARDWLKPGGWVCVEVGSYLARPLRSMFVSAGYRDVRSVRGPWPFTRVLVARR